MANMKQKPECSPETGVTIDFGDVVSGDIHGADVCWGCLAAGKSLLPTEAITNLRISFALSASFADIGPGVPITNRRAVFEMRRFGTFDGNDHRAWESPLAASPASRRSLVNDPGPK
jgi:hypothetical protein